MEDPSVSVAEAEAALSEALNAETAGQSSTDD
jgi:hypothetical protein